MHNIFSSIESVNSQMKAQIKTLRFCIAKHCNNTTTGIDKPFCVECESELKRNKNMYTCEKPGCTNARFILDVYCRECEKEMWKKNIDNIDHLLF